jgi:hypothetical protein
VPYNINWLALIVGVCFVAALVLNQVLHSLRPSRRERTVQKLANDREAGVTKTFARALQLVLVVSFSYAVLFYAFPSRHLFRRYVALAFVLTVGGVFISSLVFERKGRRKP